jgi:hypothetical protein
VSRRSTIGAGVEIAGARSEPLEGAERCVRITVSIWKRANGGNGRRQESHDMP